MGDGKCHMKGAEAKNDGEEFNVGHLRYKCLSGVANITGNFVEFCGRCTPGNAWQLYVRNVVLPNLIKNG